MHATLAKCRDWSSRIGRFNAFKPLNPKGTVDEMQENPPPLRSVQQEELNQRLSQISTQWSQVFEAHRDPADELAAARWTLLQRYSGAVYRYLLGAVRDPEVASELSQEFAFRFVRGDFRRADPERGRFRAYVKRALAHLVADHYRARQAWPQA